MDRFHLVSLCVSSWQNVVLEVPTVVGTTTEGILVDVYISVSWFGVFC